jgi:hypothetical protein
MTVEQLSRRATGYWYARGAVAIRFVRRRYPAVLAVGLFLVPSVYGLLLSPLHSPFRWIAADTFYYLTLGRNMARTGRVAFDGEHLSNGFHPLWQLWVALLELVRERLQLGDVGICLVTLSGAVVIAMAIWLLGMTLLRARRLTLWIACLPVGVYALLALPAWYVGHKAIAAHGLDAWALPVFGTLWSYVNGMESAVTILFFSLSLWLATARNALRSSLHAAQLGFALAGLTLARLDHGLIAGAMLAAHVLMCLQARSARPALVACAAFALALFPYLVTNYVVFGAIVPSSGRAKSTFPVLCPDGWNQLRALLRGNPPFEPSAGGSEWWLPIVARQFQTIVPAGLALIYCVLHLFRRRRNQPQTVLCAAGCGVIALSAYNFSFLRESDQGYWYMPVATLLPSLFLLFERMPRVRSSRGMRLTAGLSLSAGVLLFFSSWHWQRTYNRDYRDFFWKSAREGREFYDGKPPKLLEIDDGVVGYALDVRAHSCLLALDPEGLRARKEQRLLQLALSRGFDRVASFAYRPGNTTPEGIAGWVGSSLAQDVSGFVFEKEFQSSDGLLVIARVKSR